MKKEYGRWTVFLRELERYIKSPGVNKQDQDSLLEIYNHAVKNGYTSSEQDAVATEIIKRYKGNGI